jgi:hypothetical protein
MPPMNRRLPLLAALTVLCSGCSFVFGGGPPAEHQQMPYFDCPSTFGLPVADGFFAASGIIGAVATFSQSKQEYADKNNGAKRDVAGGAQVVTGAIYAASAVYGIVQANRCSAAKEQLKARILTPMMQAPLRPAPPASPPPPPLPAPLPTPAEPVQPTPTP